jgi:hypothetical protein
MAQLEELLAQLPDLTTATPGRSPDYYRTLADKTRRAYTETFWDDSASRFIGCVDADGKRHDFGFTFVNLEAMAYGLASPEQARRIYDWMETGVTSSGRADTYSRWVFAPRANTIHNPMWDETGVTDPNANDVEPWWFDGWRGTPYEEQCQDGGAILYTSFFDLMARSQLLGADNAWQRWQAILERYREPDRLCGGPPLFRGEIPQQANAGAVGLDIPFPESGLVPTWFLYGCAGVSARADGLHVAPNLPPSLPWLAIRNIAYRNLTLTLLATNDSVELTSTTPGYEFTWQRELTPGAEVVFSEPPPPVTGFPVAQRSSGLPWRWLSAQGVTEGKGSVWFRKSFDLPAAPQRAALAMAADNYAAAFVNGKPVGRTDGWERLRYLDLTASLTAGSNLLAVRLDNADGPGGLLARLSVASADGATTVYSDGSWRATATDPGPDWAAPDFDDSAWSPAAELGVPPCDPWRSPTDPGF